MIIFASNNKGKIEEIRSILKPLGIEIKSLDEMNINIDIDETGTSFEENAIIKAKTIANLVNLPVIADDSGLEIFALNGFPGIYSARFALPITDYKIKNNMILDKMKNIENRKARFVCSIALVYPNHDALVFNGKIDGEISYEQKGFNGFGFDPIFFVPQYGKTVAEMDNELKNTISHRHNAVMALMEYLKEHSRKETII